MRFSEQTKKLMTCSEEELKKAADERGRGVRCPECGAVAKSIDTLVIYCGKCGLRLELDPYWLNDIEENK
mgnify:FL=1|jgi:hypothetical protein